MILATFLQRMASTQELVAKNPDMAEYYKDDMAYIESFKPNAKEVEKLYETVIAGYAQITTQRGTLGESAEAALFEMRNLQIGMEAPDIAAADLDGVDFKLSDYRGKVVLLDFWGNW